ALRGPVRLEGYAIEIVEDFVECARVENRVAVAPDRDSTIFREPSPRLGEKTFGVEPVKCLRGSDQIHRAPRHPARVCRCQSVLDAWIGGRVSDLRVAWIRGHHFIEMSGESDRRLPVSGAAVESQPMLG